MARTSASISLVGGVTGITISPRPVASHSKLTSNAIATVTKLLTVGVVLLLSQSDTLVCVTLASIDSHF